MITKKIFLGLIAAHLEPYDGACTVLEGLERQLRAGDGREGGAVLEQDVFPGGNGGSRARRAQQRDDLAVFRARDGCDGRFSGAQLVLSLAGRGKGGGSRLDGGNGFHAGDGAVIDRDVVAFRNLAECHFAAVGVLVARVVHGQLHGVAGRAEQVFVAVAVAHDNDDLAAQEMGLELAHLAAVAGVVALHGGGEAHGIGVALGVAGYFDGSGSHVEVDAVGTGFQHDVAFQLDARLVARGKREYVVHVDDTHHIFGGDTLSGITLGAGDVLFYVHSL